MVISLDKFLKLSESNTMAVKKFLSGCVREAFLKRQNAFKNETDDREQYLGWPTVEGEIHSFLARFEGFQRSSLSSNFWITTPTARI